MLNLLPSSRFNNLRTYLEIASALCLGVSLMAVIIWQTEKDAKQEIAALNFKSLQSSGTQSTEPVTADQASNAQAEFAALKARVTYLSLRQEEREDLTEVQRMLLKPVSQMGTKAELQSLQWQNGMLEFEGLSDSPEDWHSLMNDMSLFDRWKTRPQILQTHSVASKAPQSGGSQVVLKLKANLWTHSTNASNTVTTKSEP